jgi:Ca2+-binding EF-hand superfamily protein
MLFKYYDTDGSGSLDYKEFTAIIVDNDTGKPERKSQ